MNKRNKLYQILEKFEGMLKGSLTNRGRISLDDIKGTLKKLRDLKVLKGLARKERKNIEKIYSMLARMNKEGLIAYENSSGDFEVLNYEDKPAVKEALTRAIKRYELEHVFFYGGMYKRN